MTPTGLPRDAAGDGLTGEHLARIGADPYYPRTSPSDPGYDPATVRSHLNQSHQLIPMPRILVPESADDARAFAPDAGSPCS
jgi:hypothetical protein